jgi:hypothetical protein
MICLFPILLPISNSFANSRNSYFKQAHQGLTASNCP